MENEKYLKVTNAVYSLIDLFPDQEPLKNKAKDKALAVLDNLIAVGFLTGSEREKTACQACNDVDMLLSYLSLGSLQGFVNKFNFIVVSEEYKKIKEEIKLIADAYKQNQAVFAKEETAPAKSMAGEVRKWKKISELLPVDDITLKKNISAAIKATAGEGKNSNRQEQIIKILGERGRAQVADLKQIMPDISKRTLRRDLDDLLKREKIDRAGEWNQTFYQIRSI